MNFNMELSEITAEDTVEDTMSMASAHTASEENVGGTCECMREGGREERRCLALGRDLGNKVVTH